MGSAALSWFNVLFMGLVGLDLGEIADGKETWICKLLKTVPKKYRIGKQTLKDSVQNRETEFVE